MGPKKPSGSSFRKLKKEKEKTAVTLSGQLKNWLKRNKEEVASTITDQDQKDESDIDVDADLADTSENSEDNEPHPQTSTLENSDIFLPISDQNKFDEIDYVDPKQWPGSPTISDKVRLLLVQRGPQRVDVSSFKFPVSDGDRRLDAKWFHKTLANGEKVLRQWLLYSQSEDALFCFPCVLFGQDHQGKSSPFADLSKGFKDWKHLNPLIFTHENSSSHRLSCMEWIDLKKRLQLKKTVDYEIQDNIQKEFEKWRNILKVIVDVILFCAKNNLPFRGTSKKEVIGESSSGVFLSTLELISRYHPKLAEHMAYVKSNKNVPSYFSPTIQNELINLIGGKVRQTIIDLIKTGKYFSIIFDCTPDSAHIEQMSQIIRFVDLSAGTCEVKESFIEFINTHEKTGEGISMEILQKLNDEGLNVANCRGQGYDNGSNMAGKYNGVQAKILQQNDKAYFVPCAAHSLNLIGAHAAAVSPLIITFFGTVQKLFTFFSGSTGRWQAILTKLDITLKGHCDTRWSTKRRAVSALKKMLKEVYAILKEMIDRSDRTCQEKWNLETAVGAQELIKQIDFRFMCLLQLWERILIAIDQINKALQKETVSVIEASKMIKGLSATIQEIRDEGIRPAIDFAIQTSQELGIEDHFPEKRRKTVNKRLEDLETKSKDDNTCYLTAEKEFQREVNLIFDQILTELKRRYEAMESLSSDFYFLTGPALKKEPLDALKKHAADFGLKYSTDVDIVELTNEIETFKMQAKELVEKDLENVTPLDLLRKIQELKLEDIFPNIQIALRIFLTLPVTVASCERSFSKLKLIKNYLRSSMGQDRLTNLAILSIEHEEVRKLDLNVLINDFASVKARKVRFK